MEIMIIMIFIIMRSAANVNKILNYEKINLVKDITDAEKSFAEGFWIIYVQKDVFSSEQYKQLKKDLGFIIVNVISLCTDTLKNFFIL